MYQYNTQLQNNAPGGQSLMGSMPRQSPWSYNQNHDDLMASLMQRQAVDMDRYAQSLRDDYTMRQQQAEMQNALAGLQQLSQDQQNRQNLSNSRLQTMLGFTGDILGGLLR